MFYNIKSYNQGFGIIDSYNNYQKGITLIEALFVLGIMAILLAIVMIVYSQSIDRYKTQKMFEEITLGKNITASLCSTNSNCTLQPTDYVNSGMVPNSLKQNNNIVDPWGATIQFSTGPTVYGMKMNAGSGLFFIGQIPLHSYYECIQMVEMEKTQMSFKTIGYDFGYQYLETPDGEQAFCNNVNENIQNGGVFITYFVLDGDG